MTKLTAERNIIITILKQQGVNMINGMTNANTKKFKEVYHKIIGHPLVSKDQAQSFEPDLLERDRGLDTGVPHSHYEYRTKEQMYNMARELEIDGRSYMNKEELIDAVRVETRH
jgi:polyhydroxyalkanoate synthesis regulator phasin